MRATSEEIAIFVAVVESGSFSRAAEQLGQANSAVSRAVKKLESKLGVSLLNRTTRQLSLTEEGERYFRRMQVVLQEMAAAENDVLETRTTPRGLLRVDAATPVMLHFLMPLVKPFRERYPEMTLSLVSSETFINLIERKVDVAIRAGTLTDSSLRARPLFTSYRKIVASPDYVARYGMPQHPSDLKQHHCLGFTEPVSLNTWPVSCCDGQLLEIEAAVSSNSGETLNEKLHACRGQHHFFVAANEELNGKLLFQLLNAGRDIGLCAAQPFCCLGDALRVCHLNEDLECAVVHIFLLNTIIMLILPSLKEMVSLRHR